MRLVDVDEALRLFGEEYEKTKELIHNGESQLDSLAEGFTEAHHIIKYVLPTVDAVPVVRCKDCPEKRSTVIEHRLYGNSGCVAVDTHVECAKLDLCLKLKQRLMESLRDGIICGEGDSKPLGLSRAEPPADG